MKYSQVNNKLNLTNKLLLLFVSVVIIGLLFGLVTVSLVYAATISVDKGDGSCVTGSGQSDPYAVVYCNIQDAITDAMSDDTVNIAAGTYTETLSITTDGITLEGAGLISVTVDTSNATGYGIYVSSTNVAIREFTVIGPPSASAGYGVKIEGSSSITVENILVRNSGKSGIDLNGVNGANLSNITVENNGANGLALTDVNNAQISNITTSGNAWGGLAIYTYGRYYPGGSDNILLSGTNSFSESNKLYVQTGNFGDPSNPYPLTNFTQNDFTHIVKNDVAYPGYTFYQQSADDAIAFALGLISPQNSYIQVVVDDSFLVGDGMSIQPAVNAANSNATINVTTGTFTDTVTINKDNLALQGAGTGQTILQGSVDCTSSNGNVGGIALSQGISGTTITDLTVTGFDDGIQMFTGPITNTLIKDAVASNNCRHGIYTTMSSGFSGLTVRQVNASNNNSVGPQRFGRGVWVINGVKQNITIENSVFNNNRLVGIDISDGNVTNLLITGNQVISNVDSGIGVLGPQGSGSTLVDNNTVVDNGRFGIEIKNPTGNGADNGAGSVVVSNNVVSRTLTFTGTDHAGIAVFRRFPSGDNANQPSGVVITGNQVNGYLVTETVGAIGEGFGIVIEGDDHTVAGNTVTNNDIGVQLQAGNPDSSPQDTAYFDRGDALTTTNALVSNNIVSNNMFGVRSIGPVTGTITANTIYTNTQNGVTVLNEASMGILINNNNICQNGVFGVENQGSSEVDATNNWWNATDGPGPVGPGSGDKVSANVAYSPFTTSNSEGPCTVALDGGIYLPVILKNAS